jgi:hypothetical protein
MIIYYQFRGRDWQWQSYVIRLLFERAFSAQGKNRKARACLIVFAIIRCLFLPQSVKWYRPLAGLILLDLLCDRPSPGCSFDRRRKLVTRLISSLTQKSNIPTTGVTLTLPICQRLIVSVMKKILLVDFSIRMFVVPMLVSELNPHVEIRHVSLFNCSLNLEQLASSRDFFRALCAQQRER